MQQIKDTAVTITLTRRQIPFFSDAVYYAREKLARLLNSDDEIEEDKEDAAECLSVLDDIANQVRAQL